MNLVGGFAHKLEPVARQQPNLRLIVDHMGLVIENKSPAAFRNLDELLALARYPNVYVKISSAPNFSNQPFPFDDIAVYTTHLAPGG
jgi:predicted TIM-barrel fold metal-dependent hydrolase